VLLRHTSPTIGTNREENFPAKCAPPLNATWLPPAHVIQGWPPRTFQSPSPGTHEAISLIEPLRSRASFAALSSHGRRRQGRWCWVRYAPFPTESSDIDYEAMGPELQSSPSVPQVGYAIGKKVGNAVVRNRIRRRLHPIIVAEAPRLSPGIYLIGVNNDQAAQISHDKLDEDLRNTMAAASCAPR